MANLYQLENTGCKHEYFMPHEWLLGESLIRRFAYVSSSPITMLKHI